MRKRARRAINFRASLPAQIAVSWFTVSFVSAQTSYNLLALAKSDHTVAIVDPATLQVLARLPAGPDPHEIIASDDGKVAYISNYGGPDSDLHTISSLISSPARHCSHRLGSSAFRAWFGFAKRQAHFTARDK